MAALDHYPAELSLRSSDPRLGPKMRACGRLTAAFTRRRGTFHARLATPPGWRLFTRFARVIRCSVTASAAALSVLAGRGAAPPA